MAVNNSLALYVKPPETDLTTPLLTAAKLREMEQAGQVNQLKMQQVQDTRRTQAIGASAQSVLPVVNTPQFRQAWSAEVDNLLREGHIDPARHRAWRDNPTPQVLQQALALAQAGEEPTNDAKNYHIYQRQTLAEGKVPDSFTDWSRANKRSGATNVSTNVNTTEGFSAAQTKARITIDTETAKEASKEALKGQRLMPLLDQVAALADKTPGGWAGPVSATLGRAIAGLGLEVPQGMSNAELLQSISQRMIPIVREPGPTSEKEIEIYLRAVPGLMQSPAGRKKVVDMTKKIIKRANDIAKVYRTHVGSPDLLDRLAELDKPMFDKSEVGTSQRKTSTGVTWSVD